MADINSTVEQSASLLWGAVAEAQSWLELAPRAQDDGPMATLAEGILSRLCDSVEGFERAVNMHGVLPIEQREAVRLAAQSQDLQ